MAGGLKTSIENGYGMGGSVVITGTDAVVGPFRGVQAPSAEAVVNLSGGNMSGSGASALTIAAGVIVGGRWPRVTRVSGGTVIAYY